jgi:hypothetical protein
VEDGELDELLSIRKTRGLRRVMADAVEGRVSALVLQINFSFPCFVCAYLCLIVEYQVKLKISCTENQVRLHLFHIRSLIARCA